jgi:hypothetical protein
VLDIAGEDVGNGLDAAMWVPRETGEVIGGDIVAEIVEEQERVGVGGTAEAERAAEMDTRAFESGFGFDEFVDGSNGHASSFRLVEARTPARAGSSDAGECSTFGEPGKGEVGRF